MSEYRNVEKCLLDIKCTISIAIIHPVNLNPYPQILPTN